MVDDTLGKSLNLFHFSVPQSPNLIHWLFKMPNVFPVIFSAYMVQAYITIVYSV